MHIECPHVSFGIENLNEAIFVDFNGENRVLLSNLKRSEDPFKVAFFLQRLNDDLSVSTP